MTDKAATHKIHSWQCQVQIYKPANTTLQQSIAQQLSNEWSHFRVLSNESKVRKLCITQGFTLGVKGLTNSTTVKYCSTAFQWMVTL